MKIQLFFWIRRVGLPFLVLKWIFLKPNNCWGKIISFWAAQNMVIIERIKMYMGRKKSVYGEGKKRHLPPHNNHQEHCEMPPPRFYSLGYNKIEVRDWSHVKKSICCRFSSLKLFQLRLSIPQSLVEIRSIMALAS